MIITFDLEESDQGAAFFAIYAGLRIYMDMKHAQPKEKDAFSIAGAEAYCRLQELKEQYPKEYADAEEEFEEVYGTTPFIHPKFFDAT